MRNKLRVAITTLSSILDDENSFILAGSVSDYLHFSSKGISPFEPGDVDIIIKDEEVLKKLKEFFTVHGEFKTPVYAKFRNHTQFFVYIFGVRVDIFKVSKFDYNTIDTYINSSLGVNILSQSLSECENNQYKYLKYFINYSDSNEFSRFKKHSKRLSFFNMLKSNKI